TRGYPLDVPPGAPPVGRRKRPGARFGDLPCYRPIQEPVNIGAAKIPNESLLRRVLGVEEGRAMKVYRALPLVAMLVAVPCAASAEFGGMPGMPGGMPGGVPGGGGFSGPPAAPPPGCQQLLALRDETQKHGMAIQKANERKASVQEACRLFKNFLAAETKFMKGIEEH